MPKVHTNGIDIYYEIHGESRTLGTPLVLIAGLGYPLWMWHRMIPYLAQRVPVIAFDNRGVGQTDKPAGPYTAQMLADDTAGLLQGLNVEQAYIMGHSMGGFIAQALALSQPERVAKLVLSATNFGGPHHIPITAEAMTVLTDMTSDPLTRFKNGLAVSCAPGFAEANPDIIEDWVRFRLQNPVELLPYQAQMAIGLGLLSEAACFEHKLPNLTMPALILFGAHDKVVPPGNADLLAQQLPHSQVRLLPDAGHFFPMEVPEAAAQAVLDFIL